MPSTKWKASHDVASPIASDCPAPAGPTGATPISSNRSRGLAHPAACATVAVASACSAVLATVSVADWNVTVLVRRRRGADGPVARETDPDFVFVHYHGRGDGVSYYAIARDPLAGETSTT